MQPFNGGIKALHSGDLNNELFCVWDSNGENIATSPFHLNTRLEFWCLGVSETIQNIEPFMSPKVQTSSGGLFKRLH